MTVKPIRTAGDLRESKIRLADLIRRSGTSEHDDEIEVLMSLVQQYEHHHSPVGASTPVEAIRFRMEERGLTPRQLEPFIGSRARVSEVLSGKRQLSIDMIRSLHHGLGIPYEALISERPKSSSLKDISKPTFEGLNALGLGLAREQVPSFITSSLKAHPQLLLRKTRTQRAASKTDQRALLIWQAAVLQKARSNQISRAFDPMNFLHPDLRQISKLSARSDGPRQALSELEAKGIIVVIVPALPGTFLDGAVMADSRGLPVIGLTLRHDRTDSFWFTLLHELSHVSLHFNQLVEKQTVFIDDMDINSEDSCEREADQLARNSLIPPDLINHVVWGASTTFDDLHILSVRARVHISIVAGRWQRDHQNYKRFSRLIERNTVRSVLS